MFDQVFTTRPKTIVNSQVQLFLLKSVATQVSWFNYDLNNLVSTIGQLMSPATIFSLAIVGITFFNCDSMHLLYTTG